MQATADNTAYLVRTFGAHPNWLTPTSDMPKSLGEILLGGFSGKILQKTYIGTIK